jgi:nucleoside-diphosphate-sugar epimerase
MRFLVTGSQGCIGAWVVKALLDRGLDVLCFDADKDATRLELIHGDAASPKLRMATGRIEDTGRVKSLVRDEGITHIIHLAAVLMPYCQANPVTGGLVNVIGTLNVFEGARDAGRAVRVVYASSSAVWGPDEAYGGRTLKEEDQLLPATHYGVFKQANEGNARAFFHANGISSVGLRPWTVYGAGRDRGLTADPTLAMKAAVLGVPFTIRVSGYMDLQYVGDVAETFVRSALDPLEGAYVFNLAGSIVGMEDFVEQLAAALPESRGLIGVSGPQVPVSYRMDATALHEAIPNLPRTPLEEGIRRTLEIFGLRKSEGRLSAALG